MASANAPPVVATADFGPYGVDATAPWPRPWPPPAGSARRGLALRRGAGHGARQVRLAAPRVQRLQASLGGPGLGLPPACAGRPLRGCASDAIADDIEAGVAVPGQGGLPAWWEGLPLEAVARLPAAGPAEARVRLERVRGWPSDGLRR